MAYLNVSLGIDIAFSRLGHRSTRHDYIDYIIETEDMSGERELAGITPVVGYARSCDC